MLDALRRLLAKTRPLRPPGARSGDNFGRTCIRCRKCEVVCPYDAVRIRHGEYGSDLGTPVIHARQIPCYLCDGFPCIEACPTDALRYVARADDVRMGTAVMDRDRCFAYNGVMCRSCFDRCPLYRRAITMEEELYPVVHAEACVGCGICEHVCPADPSAIVVKPRGE